MISYYFFLSASFSPCFSLVTEQLNFEDDKLCGFQVICFLLLSIILLMVSAG